MKVSRMEGMVWIKYQNLDPIPMLFYIPKEINRQHHFANNTLDIEVTLSQSQSSRSTNFIYFQGCTNLPYNLFIMLSYFKISHLPFQPSDIFL